MHNRHCARRLFEIVEVYLVWLPLWQEMAPLLPRSSDCTYCLTFLGQNFCESLFLKFSLKIFLRILKHATPTLMYRRGYFTCCAYTRSVYTLPRHLLSQMPTFEVEAMVRGYHANLCVLESPTTFEILLPVAVVKSDTALLGGTSLASAPCGSGSPHTVHPHA